MSFGEVRAIAFDVFGTVVDWRGSVAAEAEALARVWGLAEVADWTAFAEDWRAGYDPGMAPIREGKRAYVPVDVIHRERLGEILPRHGLAALPPSARDHLNNAWHRLRPWPDAVAGLQRLKARVLIATLSNGSVPCLANMAKRAGLPWDVILSADLVQQYKPRPETYELAIRCLGPEPEQVMMAAAHNGDLRHARAMGMRTAFIRRPREYGPDQSADLAAEEDWDIVVESIEDLAEALGF